jgi:hypothetical protein
MKFVESDRIDSLPLDDEEAEDSSSTNTADAE